MKVAHYVHNYSGFSGASKQAKNIAKSINKISSAEQIFLTLKADGTNKDCCVKNDEFSVFYIANGFFARTLGFVKFFISEKPDVIHFHGADFLLLIMAKLFSVKVFWKTTLYNSDDFYSLSKGRFGFVKRNLIKLIDINNTLTKQILKVNQDFLSEHKLVTIPNGVVIPNDILKTKEKNAIIVSAIIPRKNVNKGIEYFNNVLKPLGYNLIIVGPSSSTLDGFNYDYFCDFTQFLTSDKITYLGEITQDEVFEVLNNSRFLIHFSLNEGMPNIVLEAMAYGVYPITLDMDGLAGELYENNLSGFNVESTILDESFINETHYNRHGYIETLSTSAFEVVATKTLSIYNYLSSGK